MFGKSIFSGSSIFRRADLNVWKRDVKTYSSVYGPLPNEKTILPIGGKEFDVRSAKLDKLTSSSEDLVFLTIYPFKIYLLFLQFGNNGGDVG